VTATPVWLLLYHHALLIAGCCAVVMLWGVGGAPRAIPRDFFFVFGVAAAVIQMFFAILLQPFFRTSIYLLCPISFAVLWLLGAGAKRNRQDAENRRWEAELAELEHALRDRPDNPALHLRKAKLLDAAGLSAEALGTYRQVHEISAKFFSDDALRKADERLGPASRPRLGSDRRAAATKLVAWLPGARRGWILCLLAAAPIYGLDEHLFVGVLAVWLFVVWYNGELCEASEL